jgi:hypothetical protein
MACRWYLEEDDPHPIACLDFRLENLSWSFCHMESVSRHRQAAAVLMLIDCLEEISHASSDGSIFVFWCDHPAVLWKLRAPGALS